MKEEVSPRWKMAIYGIMFAGIFLTLAGLIAIMYHYTQPPPPDTDYWAERSRNLAELNAQNQDALQNYGWQDAQRGIVRLPIARAMELTVQEWQNPTAARSNLLARTDKMAPPLSPAPAIGANTNVPANTQVRPK